MAKVIMASEEEALIVVVVMLVAVEAEFRLKRVLIKWHLPSQGFKGTGITARHTTGCCLVVISYHRACESCL